MFFFAAYLLLLTTCSSKKTAIDTNISTVPLCNVNHAYYRFWTIFEDAEGIYFMATTSDWDSLYIYREDTSGFILCRSMSFPQDYVDTLKSEMSSDKFQIVPITKDTLVIFTRHTVSMLSMEDGQMLKHYAFNHDSDEVVMVDRAGALKWNPYRKTLPVMIVRFDNRDSRKWDWDSELAAEFSVETGQLNILPIKYPWERSYTNYLLASLRPDPMMTFDENRYVVGFQGSPVIFVYDVHTGKTDSFSVKNPLYVPYPAEYDTMKLAGTSAFLQQLKHSAMYDFYFSELVYDAYRDVYYRFFLRNMPEKNEDRKINEFNDKELGFTIMDKELNIVGDVYWKMKSANSSFWYPTSKGIYGFSHANSGKQKGAELSGHIVKINWAETN